ncbi:ALK and LTK ligand 2-like [Acanthopagrus latus]|uniref:ALK and LTK ligand 2-like n=1 Tax=Acanthopagrus latus TaxID=8177 RepID=UPI00187C3A5A|nr:ALK and LTK ligand 2-like [Acanthopagrus latus]XP_036942355.1 ALK and LTK ligand 2-like [Acanthopagrus latus]XP_036942356.1 ALK and LTK ligand 2-like [Acanthopagrus latus]XP_036942357.1 ALK and LTK ligand 2-like [Acanthopagrus latus]
MSGLRKHFNMGLVLLMCALTGHCGESAPSTATPAAAAGRDFRRIVEIVKQVEESRGRHGAARTEPPSVPRAMSAPVEARDLRNLKTDREEKAVVVPPSRKKEKFLKHITGPLYFSPKCRKHVYRLYHHTRDCTIPAYFKRCARLLTRLAGSPQCTEG